MLLTEGYPKIKLVIEPWSPECRACPCRRGKAEPVRRLSAAQTLWSASFLLSASVGAHSRVSHNNGTRTEM
eukprot:987138-Rhodomonas_salina.1